MHNSKLLELFNSLQKKELRDLSKWIRSPFVNQREDVIQLFDYLKAQYPFKDPRKVIRELVFTKIFPKKAYDDKKIGYTMSFLHQAIQSYLSYREFQEEESMEQIFLTRALRKKGLALHFEQESNKAQKQLERSSRRDAAYHFSNYQLHFERYEFSNEHSRTRTESFQEMSDELVIFFIASQLRQGCTAHSLQAITEVNYQQKLLPEVLKIVENNAIEPSPAITIYYNSYMALTTESRAYFTQFRNLTKQHHQCFPPEELKDIYLLAINYCIRQFNSGKSEFLEELFDLYKQGLELDVFIENNQLSRFTYKNIAMAGLGLKEFSWVEQFLHDYKDKIDARNREGFFHYGMALLYYRKPDYNRAIELLQKANLEDVLHNLDARRMLLKIYFDLDEIEALYSLLDSFRNYIYRQKGIGYHRNHYLNLIRFTKKILQLDRYDKKAVEKLQMEIGNTKALAEKKWLLEQLMR